MTKKRRFPFFKRMKKEVEEEVLKSDYQKLIVNDIVGDLFLEDTSLYYAVTDDIARRVKSKINTPGSLDKNQSQYVEGLSVKDIANLLSYSNSYC